MTLQEVISDPLRKKDILLYNTWEMLRAYLRKYADLRLLQDVKASKKHFQFMSTLTLVDLIRDVLVYGWIIRQFALGLMDASVFTLYTAGLLSFMVVSQQLIKNLVDIQLESKRFQNFIDFTLPLEKQFQEMETVHKQNIASDVIVPEIVIENLTFIYPNTTAPVLEDLNLHIPAGEKLALVGENGAGKSTLIKLLCRLYKPSSGRILINGKDIWDYNEEDYHQLFSAVFQDAMLLPFTLRDNITMATDMDTAAFQLAVERSGLSEVINKLPANEDTYLLRILSDEGVDLSGGERQKLFLARALYKTSSKMLILDEPTAALDPLAEREMYERYAQFTQGKTSIFVSHRLASTRFCDRVAFLKDGKIMELGTHDQLIAQKGEYAELFEIQAKNYRQSASVEKGAPEDV
jgi:ABC-type multidrug transport system fused ATPase/permease subunit